jgi:hypothetical protein
MPSFDQTPDKPAPFGFKISWFAVKATDPAAVVDALEFKEAMPANWASGLAAAYWDGESRECWAFCVPAGQRLGLGCKLFFAVSHDRNSL